MIMDSSHFIAFLRLSVKTPVMQSWKIFILDNLALLEKLLMDLPQDFIQDGTLLVLESMVRDARFFVSRFNPKKMNSDEALEFLVQLLKLLMPERDWSDNERPKPSRFYYPRTSPLVFIDDVLENLDELVQDTASSTRPLIFFISRLQKQLLSWNSRLKEISGSRSNPVYVNDLTETISNLAYEVEYAIDSFLVKDFPIWQCMFWLFNILKQFEQVETKTADDDDVVGFKGETESMFELLYGEPKGLHLISILGAPGQGKTTLAKRLYGSREVIDYFDMRAWCCVSQTYEKRKVLLELLSHLVEPSYSILELDGDELDSMVHKSLIGRRFLVVLDDIWDLEAWSDLERCFPQENNGSRILFTTREARLASRAKLNSTLLPVSPLADQESWELLRNKLFKRECCPPELLGVGRKIANNCKGLPLSIISTAQTLAAMEKTVDQWDRVADTLSSHILRNPKAQSKVVLELAYNNLPDRVKSCLLYFGGYLKDKEIPVSKLIRLWIAEGFIKHSESKSLEEVAEDYLMDLIGRSLLSPGQEKSNGGVKSCRVHDLLYEFCLIKAREDNFLQLINEYDKLLHSSHDTLDYGLDPDSSSLYSSTPIIYHQSRLRIHSKRNHFFMLKPCGPFVQSLLFFAASDTYPNYSYDISFIFHNFKFLRTLDFEGINIGDSLEEIDVLVLLRYLAVKSYGEFIPSSIANLWNLETFIFKGLRSSVEVPDSIWDMKKLRHVHINNRVSFHLDPHRREDSSSLENLQTFSTPILAYGVDMEKILRRLRGIRKLKCIFLDSWDEAKNCNRFPLLEFLNTLESVKVSYNGVGKYPCVFRFPSNLKKLTLSNFRMPWKEISQLARFLRNLEVLKLLSNAFKGETWEVEDGFFPQLKFLKLENLDVAMWSANEDQFPHLQRLLVYRCKRLVEIPPSFGDISTLETIEVMWCNTSVAHSARRIHEEQLEYGNEELKINIHPTEAGFGES